MSKPFLEIRNLIVHYGKVKVIKGISLKVEEGKIVCVIGANGAGKTTILRTISGLVRATSGEIYFEGRRVDSLRTHELVSMGISQVPEGRRIFQEMSVIDNLQVGAYLREDRTGVQQDLQNMFRYFPILGKRKNQLGGRLSGGEQQMLAIARALMNRPKLLLLDEPTLGLSPLMVKEIAQMVRGINENKVSVILVEQNSHVALKTSHKGYVLETGKIVLQGDTSELINNDHVREAYIGLG